MTQEHPSLPVKQVIAPPRPAHATARYDGPTMLYRLFSADDRLLYIGVTCNPSSRWESHRSDKPWWPLVARRELTAYQDRSAALTAERKAIVAERPLHNVQHNPLSDRRDVHVVLRGDRARKLEALARLIHGGLTDAVVRLIDDAADPRETAQSDEALRRARQGGGTR